MKYVSIRAGAGSGKTKELVSYYLDCLKSAIDKQNPLSELVAITFTKNAANELKDRVRTALVQYISETQSTRTRTKFRKLIQKLSEARIGTIDSFAASIIRNNAFFTSLPPTLEILDEPIFEDSFEKIFNSSLPILLQTDKEIETAFFAFGWKKLRNIMFKLRINSVVVEPILSELLNSENIIKRGIARLYFELKSKEEPKLLGFSDILNECIKILHLPEFNLPKTSFIFVDEFQDTNTAQWDIIRSVADSTKSGIVIVGDEKQSIYGFRGADYTVFNKAEKELNPEIRTKRENWRSLSRIVEFVNLVFENKELGGKLYEPIIARRDSENEGNVELFLIDLSEQVYTEKHRELIGKLIAKRLYDGLYNDEKKFIVVKDGKPQEAKPGDIAVLIRNRNFLPQLTLALKRMNIPFIVFKGSGFFETEEINDILSLLAFLQNPNDDIRLVSLLRSELLGFSDELLFKISLLDGESFYKKLSLAYRSALFSQHELEKIERFIEIIDPLIREYRNKGPSRTVMKFLDQSWAWMLYSVLQDGPQKVENLKKLLLRIIECEKHFYITDITKFITTLGEDESEAPVEMEGDQAVKIMTIHAAKGLEFPVVVLPLWKFDQKPASNTDIIIDPPDIGFRYYDISKGTYEEEEYKSICNRVKLKAKEEEERLLYVGLTRARDHLIVVFDEGFITKNKPENLPEVYKSIKAIFEENERSNGKFKAIRIAGLSDERLPSSSPSYEKDTISFEPPLFHIPQEKPVVEVQATKLVESLFTKEPGEISGDKNELGLFFGSLIHAILLFEPANINEFIDDFIKHEMIYVNEEFHDAVSDIVKKFEQSELYEFLRRKTHSLVLKEFPFEIMVKNLIIKGRIDILVLDKKEDAYIIDIKSDKIRNDLDEKIMRYSPQLWIYGYAVEKGEKITPELSLYFTSTGSWVKLQPVNLHDNVTNLVEKYLATLEL